MNKLKNTIRFYTIMIGLISIVVVLCNSGMPLVVKAVTDSLTQADFGKVDRQLIYYLLLILTVLLSEYTSKVLNSKFKMKLTTLLRRLYVNGLLQSKERLENP